MPLVPASALKGVLRRVTGRLKNGAPEEQAAFKTLFGTPECAAYVTFQDAWYDPDSVGGLPFKRDVVTVHHPDYYGKHGATWPTDFDDPNPVPFLVVRPGARFLFALRVPSSAWGDYLKPALREALEARGVGGKTNAGYGFFRDITFPGGAGGGSARPAETVWSGVAVSYEAGKRELSATSPQRVVARADGEEAQRLLSALDEAARLQLTNKPRKLQAASVTVEPVGNQWRIVRIEPPSG